MKPLNIIISIILVTVVCISYTAAQDTTGELIDKAISQSAEVIVDVKDLAETIQDKEQLKKDPIDNFFAYLERFVTLLLKIIGVASVIAAITPTDADNKFIAKILKPIRKIINLLGLNVGNAKNLR